MRIFYVILLIVLVIAAVVFAVQNSAPVTVTFLGLSANASMSIVLVITFAAGILLGMSLLLPSVWKRMRALSSLKKQARESSSAETQPPSPTEATTDKKASQEKPPADRAP
jgi:uncharacterized integral membrane protein